AAGFGSVRQFNDTIREVFAAPPSGLRRRPSPRSSGDPGTVSVRLPVRTPFSGAELFRFIGAQAIPGLEHLDAEGRLHRSMSLPRAHGTVRLEAGGQCVHAAFRVVDWRDLAPAVER